MNKLGTIIVKIIRPTSHHIVNENMIMSNQKRCLLIIFSINDIIYNINLEFTL